MNHQSKLQQNLDRRLSAHSDLNITERQTPNSYAFRHSRKSASNGGSVKVVGDPRMVVDEDAEMRMSPGSHGSFRIH